ncbi:MAG TPA: peptidoglycan-binding domain-containing protein [Alloacidobacterium sp.]|nr:peptidoglycan-binding domain-containing protein [Alloacidobacterium sp.]
MKLRSVSKGMKGPDVKAIQEGLNKYYRERVLETDGDFGGNTDRVVREFQQENGIDVDGVVGPTTRATLFPLVGVTLNFWGTRKSGLSKWLPPAPQLKMPTLPPLMPPPGQPFPRLELTRPSLLGDSSKDAAPQLSLPVNSWLGPPKNELVQFPGLTEPVWVPKVATPTLLGGSKLSVEFQTLSQGNWQYEGLFKNPQGAFAIGIQTVMRRKLLDPDGTRHLEIATGCLLQSPIGFLDGQKNNFTLGCFAQATWIEPLTRSGIVQWAPYAAVQGQANASGPLDAMGTLGGFPFSLNVKLDPLDFKDVTLNVAGGGTGVMEFTPTGIKGFFGPTLNLQVTGKFW